MLPPTLGVQTSSIVPHWADCWTLPSAGTICIPMSKARGFIRFPNPSIFDKSTTIFRYVLKHKKLQLMGIRALWGHVPRKRIVFDDLPLSIKHCC